MKKLILILSIIASGLFIVSCGGEEKEGACCHADKKESCEGKDKEKCEGKKECTTEECKHKCETEECKKNCEHKCEKGADVTSTEETTSDVDSQDETENNEEETQIEE